MKKNFKTIIITLLTGLFLIPTIHADLIPPILKDALREWFGGAIPEDYVVRILLGLLLFIIFYWAAGAVFTSERFGATQTNKFRWMVALIIAIISVVFIPPGLLQAYKQIFSMITPILLTVGLIFLIRKITKSHTPEGYIGAAIFCAFMVGIMGVMLALTDNLGIGFRVVSGWTFTDVLQLIMIGFIIATGFYIVKAFGRGAGQRLRDMGANIREGENEEDREEGKKKKKKKTEKKKEKKEKKEIKTEVKIFKELAKLRELVVDWGKTTTPTNKSGSPTYRDKVLKELERIRKDQKLRDRLEKVSIKEVKEIEHLEGLGKVMNNYKKINELIKAEANFNAVFEKLLGYISYRVSVSEPQIPSILAAIDKAMAIERREIQLEKEELKEEVEAEHQP